MSGVKLQTPPHCPNRSYAVSYSKRTSKRLKQLLDEITALSVKDVPKKEVWTAHCTLYDKVEELRKLQAGSMTYTPLSKPPSDEDQCKKLATFELWLKDNGVDLTKVQISKFPGYGYGLQAQAELEEGVEFLRIPRKLMVTCGKQREGQSESSVGKLQESDPMVSGMKNVALSLHLLCLIKQSHLPGGKPSFYQPYLDILPDSFTTPLYMTKEEISKLRGSPSMNSCVDICRCIARQYTYFHQKFNVARNRLDNPMKDYFTYDDYRWATSAVMTRQNAIPPDDSGLMIGTRQSDLALIPLWDMCNHHKGELTTDYLPSDSVCSSVTMETVKAGEQIFICYGKRTGSQMLTSNGFVPEDHPLDPLPFYLGINTEASTLNHRKGQLMDRTGLMLSKPFMLTAEDKPVTTNLRVFLRIFNSSEEEVVKLESTLTDEELVDTLAHPDRPLSSSNERKSLVFLRDRANLLLMGYRAGGEQSGGSYEEQQETGISPFLTYIGRLVGNEQTVLQRTITYTENRLSALDKEL